MERRKRGVAGGSGLLRMGSDEVELRKHHVAPELDVTLTHTSRGHLAPCLPRPQRNVRGLQRSVGRAWGSPPARSGRQKERMVFLNLI